jgi:hypothetical protein
MGGLNTSNILLFIVLRKIALIRPTFTIITTKIIIVVIACGIRPNSGLILAGAFHSFTFPKKFHNVSEDDID